MADFRNATAYQGQQQHQFGQQPPMPPPPKPPRKNPYRDGQVKSAQYYDLYEMIRSPNAHRSQRPPDPPAHYMDPHYRPPTKRQRLEKKLQVKFEKNHYRLPENRFSSLGKLVKILFFLAVLPGYILFYRLPKWLFTFLIPTMFKRVEKVISAMGTSIKRYWNEKIQGIFSLWKKAKLLWLSIKEEREKEEGVKKTAAATPPNFFTFIFGGIWTAYTMLTNPIYFSATWTYRTVVKLAKAAKNLPRILKEKKEVVESNIRKKVAKSQSWIKTKREELKQKISEKMMLFSRKCQSYFQRKKEDVSNYFKKIFFKVKISYQNLKYILLNPVDSSRKFYEKVALKFREWSNISNDYLGKIVQQGKQAVDRQKQRLKEKIVTPIERLYQQIIRKFNARFLALRNLFKTKTEPLKGLPQLIRQKIPKAPSLKQIVLFEVPKKQIQLKLNRIHSLGKTYQQQLVSYLKYPRDRFLHMVAKYRQTFLKAVHPWQMAIVERLHAMKGRWNHHSNIIQHKSYHLVMRVRLWNAWARVLTRYGMRLVQDTVDDFAPWFKS